MDVLKNTKTTKKIVILLVMLTLFNFFYPQIVRAGDTIDYIMVGVGRLFFGLFEGVQNIINDIFIDEQLYTKDGVTTDSRIGKFGGKDYIIVSAENIISGKFLLFEPNIFKKPVSSDAEIYLDYNNTNVGRYDLREIIASWYYSLRNLAILALLSVLVYVAIRMILTTIAQDKAKYKTMFKDWLVALCLLFVIHYFMVGILNITSQITNSIGTGNGSIGNGLATTIDAMLDKALIMTREYATNDEEVINLSLSAMSSTVIYAATVIMNIIFMAKYAIRSLTIIFLILLAPISCVTYPIDKISDGKAQAYDTWFKEFLYQVIIQPFHLVIYIVLISSAAELASTNLIYAMICFGVMIPAEKFIKQMFGFKDKLGSPLGAFAGGAVASQLMSSLKSVGKGGSGGKDNESNKTDNLPPNTKTVNLPGTDGSEDGGATPRDAGNTPETTAPESAQQTDGQQLEGQQTDGQQLEGQQTDGQQLEGQQTDGQQLEGQQTDGQQLEGQQTDGQQLEGQQTDGQQTDGQQPDIQQPQEEQEGKDSSSLREKIKNNRVVQFGQKAYNKVSGTKAAKAAKARFSRNIMGKYGSTNAKIVAGRMAKRGLNKAYKGAKNTGRKVIKGAATLGGALALGAFGAMFGQGKEMAMVGAGLGGKLGSSVTKKTDKVAETIEGYVGEMHNAYDNRVEKKDKREFKEKDKNITQARLNYRDRHGEDPIGSALDDELERMYFMDSHGIKQDQFNDVLSDFETYANPKGEYKLSEREAMDTAMSSALQAQVYSAKDFKDEKTMKQAYKNLLDQYEPYIRSGKISQEEADKKIRQILTGGARMKGVKGTPPLPKMEEFTITVPTARQALNIPELLGVAGSSDLTDEKIERLNTLTFKLQEKGYTPTEISNLARGNADSRAQSIYVMDRYIAQAEFLTDEKVKDSARAYIAAGKGIDVKDVEEKEVKVEMQERLELFEVGVKKEDLDGIRVLEDEVYKHHRRTDKERALGLTSKYSVAEMHEVGKMNRAIESHAKELVKEGVVTGNGRKEALEHFERAALYKGTELAHTIVVE